MVSIRKPESMTPEERDAEIASILARGLVRAHRARCKNASDIGSGESHAEELELSADASLSVQTRPAG